MRPGVFRLTGGDPNHGKVVWDPAKSLWINGCLAAWLAFAPFYTTTGALVVFFVLTYLTLLLGHSVGMHRRLIHRTFECSARLDGFLQYMGCLVGLAGPLGVIRVHDVRDWAQREPACHPFFSHRIGLVRDAFWNLNCSFEFDDPPTIEFEEPTNNNGWYRWLEDTWMLQQLPVAIVLYWFGGWPWVVWGIFARIFVSNLGHWVVTFYTHNPGSGTWSVPAAGVQASNLKGFGVLSMGECWHNNHHAFPESARIGLYEGQLDPGWLVIQGLERLGLVWNVGLPRPDESRGDLEFLGLDGKLG